MKRQSKVGIRGCVPVWITGVIITSVITMLAVALLSVILLSGQLEDKFLIYAVAIIQLVSVFAGTYITCRRCKQKYILSAILVCAGYYLVLLAATLLVFDSSFERLGQGTLMCVLGVIITSALCLINKSKTGYKKRRL